MRAKTKAALQSNKIFTAHLDGSHRNRTWLWCIHLHLPKNYRTSTAHSLQINLSICKEGYFFSDMSGHLPATAVATTPHLFDETWGQFPAVSVQLNGIFLMRRQDSFLPFNLKRCVFRSLTKHFGASTWPDHKHCIKMKLKTELLEKWSCCIKEIQSITISLVTLYIAQSAD